MLLLATYRLPLTAYRFVTRVALAVRMVGLLLAGLSRLVVVGATLGAGVGVRSGGI